MFRSKDPDLAARTPPGQRLTRGWPVLNAEPVPKFDPATWTFRVHGEVEEEMEWSWEGFRALPATRVTADFHCVTGWSKLDNEWEGVSFREIAARVRPTAAASHVLTYAPSGYTANLPLDVVMDEDVLFAWSHGGEPLEPKHGGPLRLVVPKRYAWKSVKWAIAVRFLERDQRGYWEERGYHNNAEPWPEERYSWQEGR
jgi:DMSO/TMAO reductase YedYZ molybdopterin-dependent catalytic subunit